MRTTTPIHWLLANKMMELIAKGTHRAVYGDQMNNGTYSQHKMASNNFSLNQEIVIVDQTVYHELTMGALKMLIQIQMEMKPNNPLWVCKDKGRTTVRQAIAQLKSKDILWSVGNTDMFIVNPEKIRRGRPLASLAALYRYCQLKWEEDKNWRISEEDIRRLTTPDQVMILGELSKL